MQTNTAQQQSDWTGVLDPLIHFYAGKPLPAIRPVLASDVPEPYKGLLVHDSDMTSTLEAFHGGPLKLRVLRLTIESDILKREVVLELESTGNSVEFGAIEIFLQTFPEPAQRAIRESYRPLGAILSEFGVAYVSQPSLFFRVDSDVVMQSALDLKGEGVVLFGRCNALRTPEGRLLAEVVEILPPVNRTAS